jgi:hypothetical protein
MAAQDAFDALVGMGARVRPVAGHTFGPAQLWADHGSQGCQTYGEARVVAEDAAALSDFRFAAMSTQSNATQHFNETAHADLRAINALGMHRDLGGCDACRITGKVHGPELRPVAQQMRAMDTARRFYVPSDPRA